MRVTRLLLSPTSWRLALRRMGNLLFEGGLFCASIAGLEMVGRYAPNDGGDLVGMALAVTLVLVFVRAAAAGWLPTTRRAARRARTGIVAWARRFAPRYAVAFRRSPGAEAATDDRALLLPIGALGLAVLAIAILGPRTFAGLSFLKHDVSYTLYLLALAAVWGLLGLAVAFGSVAAAQWVQTLRRARAAVGRKGPSLLLLALLWLLGLIALTYLPGAIVLGILLAMTVVRGAALARAPLHGYLFCRRDPGGQPHVLEVPRYLMRVHLCFALLLLLVVAVGQGQRLWQAGWPAGPFAITQWFGILASLCSILLAARAGAHFQRMMGGGGIPPEVPLTRTIWIMGEPDARAAEEAVAAPAEPWMRVARDAGWLLVRSARPPSNGFDLVVGDPGHSKRFEPRAGAGDEDLYFQLERRFHVVMRRQFYRRFRSLYKALRAGPRRAGSGFLFCPHVWLVPGVVRDAEPDERRRTGGGIVGPTFHGPPYAHVFHSRTRRYVGEILRSLQIDVVFWEDAVGWPDIRRVLGVAFEAYDQGRVPLEERHFIGLPRVRVVIQEEAAEPDPKGAGSDVPGVRPPAPGHARILVIVRDRGQHEEELTPDPVDTWLKTPQLV